MDEDELRERLTMLLLTVPHWVANYTTTRDMAIWLMKEADRVGWQIEVTDKVSQEDG